MTSTTSDARSPDHERWFSFRWFGLALALFLVLRFWGVFTGAEAFTLRDFSMFGYPLAAYLQQSLFAGELPLWNPLNQAGMPFLAQWNTMALYPPMLAAAMLPLAWSLSVFCILHQLLGGLGAWCLAHRFTNDRLAAALAGVAFVGNGLVQNCLMWPNNIAALGWMPWVVLAFELAARERGRMFFVAAFAAGMQMLTGGPEIILLTWILTGGLVLIQAWQHTTDNRERSLRVAIVAGLGIVVFALSAAQLLPFLELLKHSHREAGFGGNEWAATPMAWANFFAPMVGKTEAAGGIFYHVNQSWTHSYYAGLPVLAFAFVAPFIRSDWRVWVAASGGLIFLLTSMGAAGMIFPWLSKLPPLDLLRFPVKYLLPLSLLLPLLAAIGFAHLRKSGTDDGEPCCRVRLSILLGAIVVGWIASFLLGRGSDEIPSGLFLGNSLVRLVALGIAISAVVLMISAERVRSNVAAVVVIVVIGVDLQIHQPNLAPTMPAGLYREQLPQLAGLKEQLPGRSQAALTSLAIQNLNANALPNLSDTFLVRRLGMFGNANLIDGLPKVNGFYSLYLKNYREVQAMFHATDDRLRKPVADFLGVSHAMYYTNMFHWIPRAGAMPFVTGGQIPMLVSVNESLPRFSADDFDPRKQVVLPAEIRGEVLASSGVVKIQDLTRSPHQIGFTVNAQSNSVVVIAQAHYPAWRATVNGEPASIHRANHAFQALTVPAGENRVELSYEDGTFKTGLAISLVTLLICLGGLIRWRSQPRVDPATL